MKSIVHQTSVPFMRDGHWGRTYGEISSSPQKRSRSLGQVTQISRKRASEYRFTQPFQVVPNRVLAHDG